ncbi:hypothetical protein GCM10011391_20260 [Pullulanibacillus camelliae]|uniref:Cell division protein SepF n=1 Tax=Pullulanibacillus camelliae TaxID=1707096 RepID=A0A8J2W3F5_9BACL|nr:cell division protein SepF [Pullulanibacillus camelliae]GGE41443.1 hypothetical protein GCM10011391_20260 [Pullulanibacillus camelliae]
MGFKDSFKQFFNLDEDLEEQMAKMEASEEQERSARSRLSRRNHRSLEEQETAGVQEQLEHPAEVAHVNPYNFDDVQMIIDEAKHHKIVIFNLSKVTRVEAKRMLDFISGAVYALDAQIAKVHNHTFVFALDTLDIEPVLSDYNVNQTS